MNIGFTGITEGFISAYYIGHFIVSCLDGNPAMISQSIGKMNV